MDDLRRPLDGNSHPTLGCDPKSLHNGFSCLVTHLSPLRFLIEVPVMSRSKHDLTNWFGFPSDEPVHETVPLCMGPNVVMERNETMKCNKQGCNKVPDKPLINGECTEKWRSAVWGKGTGDGKMYDWTSARKYNCTTAEWIASHNMHTHESVIAASWMCNNTHVLWA